MIVPSNPNYLEQPMNTLYLAECYVTKAKSAKKAGKHFDMTFATFSNVRKQTHCAYSGIEFTKTGEHTFSFERIDNSLGYVDGNVIAVSRVINSLRSSLETVEQVDQHIARIFKNELIAEELLPKLYQQRDELKLEKPIVERELKPIIPASCIKSYYHNLIAVQSLSSKNLNYFKLLTHYNEQILKIQKSNKSKENKKNKINSLTKCVVAVKRKINENEKSILTYRERMGKNILPRQSNCLGAIKNTQINTAMVSAYNSQMDVLNEEIDKNKAIIERSSTLREQFQHVRNGLEKFSNLSKLDKECLKLGYPLGTSKAKIIRQKISGKIANEVH